MHGLHSSRMSIRVRFAPSPTGYLHVGGLRTALYNYLFARHHGGTFILRVEDTDRERLVEGATEKLLNIFPVVGLPFDEGPVLNADGTFGAKGSHGPYIQSQRLSIYKEHVDKLVAADHAYHCFCTPEELDAARKAAELMKQSTKYNRRCLGLSKEEVVARLAAGTPNVVRLHVPEGETYFTDVVRGPIRIDNAEVDDQVLLKTDGFPTYHLANVVDDHLMEITHVIRAEEWISSTPKHVILYKAFGWTAPEFAHLPLLLNPDRSKLSKRQGDVAAEDYLAKGYLADALVNFVALMGFNPKADQEIYTLDELIQLFDLSKVNPSGAVFNREKLDWMNGMYMRAKPVEELAALCRPFLTAANKMVEDELLRRILTIEAGRMTTLVDSVAAVDAYTTEPQYEGTILVWKKADAADAKANLTRATEWFAALSDADWTVASMEANIKERITAAGLSNGNVLWPLRVALSGREQSASPFELAWVLGRERTLSRIQTAIGKL